jgi:hypothetical protein
VPFAEITSAKTPKAWLYHSPGCSDEHVSGRRATLGTRSHIQNPNGVILTG